MQEVMIYELKILKQSYRLTAVNIFAGMWLFLCLLNSVKRPHKKKYVKRIKQN